MYASIAIHVVQNVIHAAVSLTFSFSRAKSHALLCIGVYCAICVIWFSTLRSLVARVASSRLKPRNISHEINIKKFISRSRCASIFVILCKFTMHMHMKFDHLFNFSFINFSRTKWKQQAVARKAASNRYSLVCVKRYECRIGRACSPQIHCDAFLELSLSSLVFRSPVRAEQMTYSWSKINACIQQKRTHTFHTNTRNPWERKRGEGKRRLIYTHIWWWYTRTTDTSESKKNIFTFFRFTDDENLFVYFCFGIR